MRLRRVLQALPVLTAFVLIPAGAVPTAAPSPGSAPASVPASTAEGKAWLLRIHEAASERNYEGTLVFTAGSVVSSSRIAHYGGKRENYERIEVLDGQARQVLRHNDLVQTVWPASRLAVIEHRDALAPFPALLQPGGEEQLFERYEVKVEGQDRVAGRESDVLMLRPRDEARYAQRLWADRDSGLLLRTDVVGADGRVLESAAFTEIKINVRPQPEAVLQAMKKLSGYRVVRASFARTQMSSEGWALQSPVPGFRQISCVKRPLEPTPASDDRNAADVLQTIFSDGLTHVSVFIEPYNAARHKPVMISVGATNTLMQRRDDWWVTVMGDVPTATLKQFQAALERRP